MKYILETERLRLREFILADTKFIIELVNTPGWIQYIGERNVKTDEQAVKYLENGPLKSYAQHGFGLYLAETKDDKKPIGMCGILKRDNLENPDIGFAFLPDFNGKGYAFEVASATLSYATNKLNLPTVLATVLPDNARSIKLLEKLGLRFIKTFCYPDSKQELRLYSN
ncbi:GNAT family N-acetyltransferase [Pontibacter vulgaris]|uniref:GNAT family N-acetyltransferase n=1 Tax=Pontibacter vulgaris TaxID=2905679 RepID=UPI001FA799BD|nr:GNAT family N-acetyltransferase [Pontibacter vulgaris]